ARRRPRPCCRSGVEPSSRAPHARSSGCARPSRRAMSELERHLDALRDEIAWPETPVLRPAYGPRSRSRLRLRPLAIALAVLLAVLAGVLALSPGARSA